MFVLFVQVRLDARSEPVIDPNVYIVSHLSSVFYLTFLPKAQVTHSKYHTPSNVHRICGKSILVDN